ncbi:MAG: M20/M25/M40 family metallo-hydrolase [Deltaproteobacteria bacterium]|nr:M20/M25/M40 family metallo-hydrolase [Deltaproteobacteria bacterium]
MPPDLARINAYIDAHRDRFVEELRTLVRQPSISSQNYGVKECGELIRKMMEEVGIEASVLPTNGQPVVFGRLASPKAVKTLLIYNHYDVQPVEPLDAWEHPPFEATMVGERIVGRGSTDSKGNLLCHLKAVEAFLKTDQEVPVNLKFLFDGEEEIGSPSLPDFVEKHRDSLAADGSLSFDGGFDASGQPRIQLGSSGLLYIEIRARGPKRDLHSARARLVENPAWKLVWALQSMKGRDERILIDHFYDDILPPTEEELKLLEDSGWDDRAHLEEYGVDRFLLGLTGIAASERLLFQPTCNISGFKAGHLGEGMKTIVPAEALVKVDFRLVHRQNPLDILEKVKRHLAKHGFSDLEVHCLGYIEPSRTPFRSRIAQALISAARENYRTEPVIKPTGEASGRQGPWLASRLGIEGAASGVGPPKWRGHAPNEFITTGHFIDGIKYAANVWSKYAQS